MSPHGDRRVAVPVPVYQKPSVWKTIRQNIRLPLRRFASQEDRNPYDDQMNMGDFASPYPQNTSGSRPRSPLGWLSRRDNKQQNKHRKRTAKAQLTRVMSDPELSRQASPYRTQQLPYYESPYHMQETARAYESHYGTQRFDPRVQQNRDTDRYEYGMKFNSKQRPYEGHQNSGQYYRQPTAEYYENPYYQQDLTGRYDYAEDNPRRTTKTKMLSRKALLEKARRRGHHHLVKQIEDPCVAPKIACASARDVFDTGSLESSVYREEETETSGSWTGVSGDLMLDGEKNPPSDGVLESTILQTYTDNTLDASALDVEAHNAVLQLSDKVKKEIRHSAEEMGAVFTKATNAFLSGNQKNGKNRHRQRSSNDDRYGRYMEKFDTTPDGPVTDVEEETMGSSMADSSSEEIDMTWPQWRQLTNGTLSFGKSKKR